MKIVDHTYRSQVVDILSASFDDNQSINYIIKNDSERKERIRNLMAYCFDVCLEKGHIFMNDDDTACALVQVPGKSIGLWKSIQLNVSLVIKSIGIFRAHKVSKRERIIKSNQPIEPFYYLWFIGVDPTCQGEGKGSLFIQEVLRKCDENKGLVYLETSVQQNLPWYEKFGFKVFKEIDLGYKLYLMLRTKQ